ncbi:MAG: hypothetical protein K2M87_01260 [Muribaculaceae bacterium]|nr:hypothetical protein [Muribaculaceae bacterium]
MAQKIHYKSDFDFLLRLHDANGRIVPPDQCAWRIKLWTACKQIFAEAGRTEDGQYFHCIPDGDKVRVIMDSHRLTPGVLHCELTLFVPDCNYPDFIRSEQIRIDTGITLTLDKTDLPDSTQIEVSLPLVKGDPFLFEDFTPEQIAHFALPGIEGAREVTDDLGKQVTANNRAIEKKQNKLEDSADVAISRTNSLMLTDRAKVYAFDYLWQSIGGVRLDNGSYRMTDTGKELTPAEAMVRYERNGFITQWRTACGQYGDYNEYTCLYELNGITDITHEQAQAIMAAGAITSLDASMRYRAAKIRTNLPPQIASTVQGSTLPKLRIYAIADNSTIEVLNLSCRYANMFLDGTVPAGSDSTIHNVPNLTKIVGAINASLFGASLGQKLFGNCPNLTDFKLLQLKSSIALHGVPKISLESLQYMVNNAANGTKAITIEVHPNVYAKLTGDTSNAAAAALSEEELAAWQQLVTTAIAKNISFTC